MLVILIVRSAAKRLRYFFRMFVLRLWVENNLAMKRCIILLAALTILVSGFSPARATTKYWDLNGTDDGAGGPSPTGAWNLSALNWNQDSTGGGANGGTEVWVPLDDAVFSAGTDATGPFTVTPIAGITATSVTIEEGFVTIGGVNSVNVGTGTVNVASGAGLITNSSFRIAASAGAIINVDGGTLQTTQPVANGSFVDGDFKITLGAGGGTFDYQVANILNIIGNAVDGTGSLTKTGVGVLALSGTGTYGGSTTVNDGEFRMRTTPNRLPITTDLIVNSPGIFNINGPQSQQVASLTGNGTVGTGSGTLTVSGSASTTFDGALKNIANAGAGAVTTGNGRLTKAGTGVLTLTSPLNDLKGRITMQGGGLVVASGATLCDAIADLYIDGGKLTLNNAAQTVENISNTTAGMFGEIELGSGHVLTTDPVASTTFEGLISGGGGLTKANVLSTTSRALTLTHANTYAGGTVIDGGSILANNASGSATGSGPVTVNGSGTLPGILGGTGSVAGAVTVNSGGRIAPGTTVGATVGTLSAKAGVTMADGSHLAIDINGATADLLAVTGNLNLSALNNFLDVTATSPTGSSWLIATYTGTLSGTFENVTAGYTVNTATTGSIFLNAVVAGTPGDYNNNGTVDAADYVLWRNGGTLSNDPNPGNPTAQYDLWKANFGKPPGSGSGSGLGAVPEPATLIMLLAGLALFATGWRQH